MHEKQLRPTTHEEVHAFLEELRRVVIECGRRHKFGLGEFKESYRQNWNGPVLDIDADVVLSFVSSPSRTEDKP